MTLLDTKPPQPPGFFRKFGILLIFAGAVLGGALGYWLWDYPEERAVTQFLEALQRADYREAYRLWQPAPSYTFDDFVKTWGAEGDYGKIREFKILESKSKGASTVIVTVQINHVDSPIDLVVDRRTKGLAFSIF